MGKTTKSILISAGARLAPFDIEEVREVTMYDELELDALGDRKTVLFLIMSDTDSTFNFLISMKLKAIYKDNTDTIVGNCDSQVFLGGSEPTTLKELTEALGKETIDTYNTSDTRGNSPSLSKLIKSKQKETPTKRVLSEFRVEGFV